VAPDLSGFGLSQSPPRSQFKYTFDNLATVIEAFTEVVRLQRYALYVFDYGAPVGCRLATRQPDRVTAIITQNGNAYVEGLSDGWNPIRAYWKEPTQANRDALRTLLTPETTYWQYTTGVKDASLVSPDGYNLDNYYMTRPGAHDVQLDLFLDYASNVALYPEFQRYIFVQASRLSSRCGEKTIPSSCHTVLRRSDATFPVRWSISLTRATSHLRPMPRRSRQRSATSQRNEESA
jgi:pimeloyl-ACP methyl ester carboxylesterase